MAALRRAREAQKRRFVDEDYSYDSDNDAVEEFRNLKAWRRHDLGCTLQLIRFHDYCLYATAVQGLL